MQHLNRLRGRRVSELTLRDIAEIRALATSPSTALITVDGLVQSLKASDAVVGGLAGVLAVGRVAWIMTHCADHFLAWCAFQMWPLHPGKRTWEDENAEMVALPIVGKRVGSVHLADISLAQEFALLTDKSALEIAIEEDAIYVAYAFTVDGMRNSIEISPANRTVIFSAKTPPSEALASLTDLHRALRADRS